MTARPLVVAVAPIVAGLLGPPGVASADGLLVVVLTPEPTDVVTRRLSAELLALGFEVRLIEQPPSGAPQVQVEEVARQNDAAAAISIVPSRRGVEVWLADRVTDKVVLREVVTGEGTDPATVVALRAVELLRASLMEVHAPHPVRGPVAPTPEVRELGAPAPGPIEAAFALRVGGAFAFAPGGIGATGHVEAAVRWTSRSRLGIAFELMLPLSRSRPRGPEGRAEVLAGWIALAAFYELVAEERVRLAGGLGLGALLVRMRGEPAPGYTGRVDRVVAALFEASVTGSVRLSGVLSLYLDAGVGLAVPRPVVIFAGRQEARWGRPFTAGALGAEVALP